MCINKKLSRIFYPRPSFCSIPKTLTPNFQRIRVQSEAAVSSSSPTLQRLRVETRDGVTVTKRGRKQISRASSSSTPEKIRRPPPESRASFSPFLPNPPLHHSLHVFNSNIDEGRKACNFSFRCSCFSYRSKSRLNSKRSHRIFPATTTSNLRKARSVEVSVHLVDSQF
ncbi:hypothetical protein AAHE18_06G182900 [Arachis hypogaea]